MYERVLSTKNVLHYTSHDRTTQHRVK